MFQKIFSGHVVAKTYYITSSHHLVVENIFIISCPKHGATEIFFISSLHDRMGPKILSVASFLYHVVATYSIAHAPLNGTVMPSPSIHSPCQIYLRASSPLPPIQKTNPKD
jgi:hypothetical protein